MNPLLILKFLWKQKAKAGLLLFLITIFVFLLFPLEDLRDLVSIKVYEQSGQKVFILFNTVNIGLLPPHLSVGELKVSAPPLASSIEARQVTVIPYSDLFIKQVPAGEVVIEGLWSGQTRATLKPGKLLENNIKSQEITLTTEKLNLKELTEALSLPLKFKGQANLSVKGVFDPSFVTQPDFDFDLYVKNLELPASQIETLLGPLNLPQMRLGEARLKGRWAGGKAQIESIRLNKSPDNISGSGKGYFNINLQYRSGQIIPETGSYQLELDLLIGQTLEPQLGLFLSLLEPYKTQASQGGSRYRFKLSGNNFYSPPNFGPLN
jgi:hypothetical protein